MCNAIQLLLDHKSHQYASYKYHKVSDSSHLTVEHNL